MVPAGVDEGLPHAFRERPLGDAAGDAGQRALRLGDQDLVDRPEVAIDGAPGDACGLGDVLHRRLVDALGDAQLQRAPLDAHGHVAAATLPGRGLDGRRFHAGFPFRRAW